MKAWMSGFLSGFLVLATVSCGRVSDSIAKCPAQAEFSLWTTAQAAFDWTDLQYGDRAITYSLLNGPTCEVWTQRLSSYIVDLSSPQLKTGGTDPACDQLVGTFTIKYDKECRRSLAHP